MSDAASATDLPTTGTGGDSLTQDLNVRFDYGSMAWIFTSSALVWIMIPGIGLLYSGLSRKKNAISLLWQCIMAASLIAFQWFFWGYSLTFSHKGGAFLGKLDNFCLMKVLGAPSVVPYVPDVVFCFYQGMFACVTGIIMLGGANERAKLGPMMLYLFIWMTVVYAPIACWTWGPKGWLVVLGSLDYAGGGPVHMSSGAGALAYAFVCGRRYDPEATKSSLPMFKPNSVTSAVFGTIFLWFGWFGFNGGSTGNASIRSGYALLNTNLAAGCGALTWLFVDYFRFERKWTTIGMCSGAVAGLVGITPGAGYVPIYFSVPIGMVAAIGCNYATTLKYFFRIDDGLDVFALHGVGGFLGSFMTGLFAADYVAALDGTSIKGGWINHHWKQVGYQMSGAVSILAWSFGVSTFILTIMKYIPFMSLRLTQEQEVLGTDLAEIGEQDDWLPENVILPPGFKTFQPVDAATSSPVMGVEVDENGITPLPYSTTPPMTTMAPDKEKTHTD
ncbi:uncharacterized protein SAPINGB_P001653 [Magnusiomyces paraingens]|uniref:Ammonium transporter n=1 Tax=Magnusiomyces paraingens TaxID=2606893 RepID=A0A5E8BCX3_9ASCO|nr:uncharacterized protein SAPINGB_P001653 [Saprochaete ingens]VVT47321.1 unnamed protein product [Saprochaete ingens]